MKKTLVMTSLAVAFGSLAVASGCGGCGDEDSTHNATDGDADVTEVDADGDAGPPRVPTVLRGASRGAAIALSYDDARVVVVNRDSGTVSVFAVTYSPSAPPTLTRVKEIPICEEPWQVVVHPTGKTAYVVCRKDQKVVSITGIDGADPAKGAEVKVGSEPTSIALTPAGKTAWVANWVDGTVQSIDTATMTAPPGSEIDLNAALVAGGYLGTVAARPALAHPRSIAISNNQDEIESDETMYVTEYFAQQKAPLASDGANADTARVGLVYKIPLATRTPAFIELSPMNDMGFKDHKGGTAGCFPNQLQSIMLKGPFGYVTSVCASPKGPMALFSPPADPCPAGDGDCPGQKTGSCVNGTCTTNCTSPSQCGVGGTCTANLCTNTSNVKTAVAPAVTILDLGGKSTIATVSLNDQYWRLYDKYGTPPDSSQRRMPLLVNDGAFLSSSSFTSFFTAGGADAVFRVDFNSTYKDGATVDAVGGGPLTPFIDLGSPDATKTGAGPVGIAVTHGPHPEETTRRYAFVSNDATRNVSVIDLTKNEVAGGAAGKPVVEASSAMPTGTAAVVAEGKRLFNFGLSRWSLDGQGWGSCAACHVDGLSDNVTWFFVRGPRQTLSIDGSYSKKSADQRVLGWNASFDEASDLETGVLRTMFGGVGLIVKDKSLVGNSSRIPFESEGHGGLNGSSLAAANPANPASLPNACVIDDWAKVVAYLKTIRTPRRPTKLDTKRVDAGRALFAAANCAGCHGGELWSTSSRFYTPDPMRVLDGLLRTTPWTQAVTDAAFPIGLLPAQSAGAQTMRYNGGSPSAFDALTCALRPVGTYGATDPGVEPGVVVVEKRRDMETAAQGDEPDGKGYSPPSLLGLSVGGPYYHGGNARTLEAALGTGFVKHHAALSTGFLPDDPQRASKVADIVHFLLSLDADTVPIAIPALGPTGGFFCAKP